METTQKITDSKAAIALLAELFPQTFSIKGEAKPLKIGIFQDLAERLKDDERISKTTLRSTLRHYTNAWRYLESIKEGVLRIDLDGQPDVAIEAEHAEFAAQQLAESKAKVAEKKKLAAKKPKASQKHFKKPAFKSKDKQNAKPNTPKPEVKELTSADLVIGKQVSVKVGKVPMSATITELAKDGIQVQLDSGMSVKVQQDQLRITTKRK
jgi:ProP effector